MHSQYLFIQSVLACSVNQGVRGLSMSYGVVLELESRPNFQFWHTMLHWSGMPLCRIHSVNLVRATITRVIGINYFTIY